MYFIQHNIHCVYFNKRNPIISSKEIHRDTFIRDGFSLLEFQQAKSKETQLERMYDVTAVLLHWKRLASVKKSVQYLLDTRLFKEIIIWNNNPNINLTLRQIINNNHSIKSIHIINSKANLKDEAKYRACSEAKTRACFYVDDDWDTSGYIKSLIASFRSDPYVLHSITDAYTFYTNLIWSYFDHRIDLHTGFSWIGCGSIFLREHAQQHLKLLHKYLKNDRGLVHVSDVFFSIWLNEIPSQMNANLRPLPTHSHNKNISFSFMPHFAQLQYNSSVLAIRILERSLRLNSSDLLFPRQRNRHFPYYVKSPSLNDQLIFYSDVLPLTIQEVSFNISRDYERGTRRKLPRDLNVKYFQLYSTWKAVDGDLLTCWQTHKSIQSGNFFAIDVLRIQTNITFTIVIAHSPILQLKLDIRISFDGLYWISYRSLKGIFSKINRTAEKHLHTYLFNSAQFTRGFQSFRHIKFQALNDSDHFFRVCEIQIIVTKNTTDIMANFQQLNNSFVYI